MAKIKVSKNLYRGRRLRTWFGLWWQDAQGKAIAYDLGDGRWVVRPVSFFLNWGEAAVTRCLKSGRLYTTK